MESILFPVLRVVALLLLLAGSAADAADNRRGTAEQLLSIRRIHPHEAREVPTWV